MQGCGALVRNQSPANCGWLVLDSEPEPKFVDAGAAGAKKFLMPGAGAWNLVSGATPCQQLLYSRSFTYKSNVL